MGVPALLIDKVPVMIDPKDLGKADSLRYNVIIFIKEANYERAIAELRNYYEKPSDFPKFKGRIERYIQHAIDLVRAIEMKRNFPGLDRLTIAKQQDLKFKIKQHIDELVFCIRKIERVEMSLRHEDVRSTVLIVRAVVISAFSITLLAFVLELVRGLFVNTVVVADDLYQDFFDMILRLF